MNGAYWAAIGIIENSISIPKAPNFVSIPESSMEPEVDASVCASGSQKCIGNIGMFIMNARKKSANITDCIAGDMLAAFAAMYAMLNECTGVYAYIRIMPRSRNELASISYIRKLMDAAFLFAEPRMFIMRKSAITPMSQNMKKSSRFADTKNPTAASWNRRIRTLAVLGFSRPGLAARAATNSTTADIISNIRDMISILNPRLIPSEGMYGYCSDMLALPVLNAIASMPKASSMFISVDARSTFLWLRPNTAVAASAIIGMSTIMLIIGNILDHSIITINMNASPITSAAMYVLVLPSSIPFSISANEPTSCAEPFMKR